MIVDNMYSTLESFDDVEINGEKVLSYFLDGMSDDESNILKLMQTFADRDDRVSIDKIFKEKQNAILVVETASNVYRFFANLGFDIDFASSTAKTLDLKTQSVVSVDVSPNTVKLTNNSKSMKLH